MARWCLAIVLICALGGHANAGIWRNLRPDLVHSHFTDVCFADALRGWVVGSPGYVLHTTDGGASWGDPVWICWESLHGVEFVDSLRGWTVESPGARIYHSTDGGREWHEQQSGVSGVLKAVEFVDSLHGWAVGWKFYHPLPATILRTTNGGETWIDESPGLESMMRDVCFVDTLLGWAVATSDTPNLLRSTDGGQSWHRLGLSTTRGLLGVDFLNQDEGWVVGDIDSVYHTTNGGDSWTPYPIAIGGFTDVDFWDPSRGWATSGRRLFVTATGGVTWSEVASGTSNSLAAVEFSHPRNGVSVGEFSALVHSSDGGQRWEEAIEPSNDLFDIARVDVGRAWAVGANGVILHTRDAGETWKSQGSGTDTWLLAVSFVDSLNGWAVGGPPPILLHTEDGGEGWEPQSIGAVNPLVDVGFVDTQVGWALETGGRGLRNPPHVYRTTTGGDSWESQELDPSIWWLGGGYFVNADSAWLVGETWWPIFEGVVCSTTNGGAEWTIRYRGGPSLGAIHFPTPDSGWAVGCGGVILRTTNGGSDWQTTQYPGISDFYDVTFVDSRRGWTVGMGEYTGNVSIRTTDGGESWIPDSVAGQSWEFHSVSFLDAEHGWVCSRWGGVWEYGAQVRVEEEAGDGNSDGSTQALQLGPCRPNPCRASTAIAFVVPDDDESRGRGSLVELKVYNILGQLVTPLIEEVMQAGQHVVRWDGTNECGVPVRSGMYLLCLEVNSQVRNAKVVLLQ